MDGPDPLPRIRLVARQPDAETVPFASPAQPQPDRAKMWMLHAFGSNARQTAFRNISACESPFSTATCAAAGLPTTHSFGNVPLRPWLHGGGNAIDRCGESG